MENYSKRVGFVGLGAMGKHMAAQLATKLPTDSRIFVYDVVKGPIDELTTKFPEKVIASESPRDVAKNTVWDFLSPSPPFRWAKTNPIILNSLMRFIILTA